MTSRLQSRERSMVMELRGDFSEALYGQTAYVRRVLQRFGLRDWDLDDACQEVLFIAHRRGSSFEHRSELETWLYGICRYVVYGHHRRAHRRRERMTADGGQPTLDVDTNDGHTPFADLAHRQRSDALQRALAGLKPSHSEPLLMYEVGQLSADEVAKFLRAPSRTIRARIYAARRELKRRLGKPQATSSLDEPLPDADWFPPPPLPGFPQGSAHAKSLHVSYCDDTHCVASIGHVVITCSLGRPSVKRARAIGSHVASVASAAPGKVVVLQCADATPELPEADWRREFGNLARHFSSDIAAYALVMSHQPVRRMVLGFIASTVLLFRPSLAACVPSDVDEAVRWLQRRDALGHIGACDIEAALAELRRRLKPMRQSTPAPP